MRTLFAVAAILMALVASASADPLAEAIAANLRGDYVTALQLVRPLAEQGDVRAQNELGFMYQEGSGVTQDYLAAAAWYRKAADQDYADAQYHLGVMHEQGTGVPQDDAAAIRWYRKAAAHGDTYDLNWTGAVQFALGDLYEKRRDYFEAARWYRESADRGAGWAQYKLGGLYDKGWGVPQDYAEAIRWIRKSVYQSDVRRFAQYSLGVMYAKGRGVPQDYVQAHMWFNLASVSRFSPTEDEDREKAIAARDGVAKMMTPAQIAEAQRLAREWPHTTPAVPNAK